MGGTGGGGLVDGSWGSHPFRVMMLLGGHTRDAVVGTALTHRCAHAHTLVPWWAHALL